MTISRPGLSRRSLLRGLGVSAALAPFVPLSRADDSSPPKRLLVFFSSNGTIGEAWDPDPDMNLPAIVQPLAPFADDLLFVSGLRMECAYHGEAAAHAPSMNGLLTGMEAIPNGPDGEAAEHGLASGISVDQFIAGRIADQTRFPSLELGVAADGGVGDALGFLSHAGPSQPLLPENDPQQLFARVFGDLDPSGSDAVAAQRLADRRSVLDSVRADLARIEPQLPSEDRQKMQAHLQAVRDIERSLEMGNGSGSTTSCTTPPEPTVSGGSGPAGGLPGQVGQVPEVARAQMDLLVMALACDLTRVSSLMLGGAGSGLVYDWLGHSSDHHTLAHSEHDPSARQQLIEINTWIAEQFAYLLARLQEIPEGDGTLLDNTIVLWVNEMATGSHDYEPMRIVMSGGGAFTTGRHVQLSGSSTEHNNLLVSLCHATGHTDVTSFGNPAWCTGPLDALV